MSDLELQIEECQQKLDKASLEYNQDKLDVISYLTIRERYTDLIRHLKGKLHLELNY